MEHIEGHWAFKNGKDCVIAGMVCFSISHLEKEVKTKRFANRTHAIEYAVHKLRESTS